MSASLVGSEMCIRDSSCSAQKWQPLPESAGCAAVLSLAGAKISWSLDATCLLYTSDAADDM
eukprot:3291427-Alexandrium_andersonii.AAC.1